MENLFESSSARPTCLRNFIKWFELNISLGRKKCSSAGSWLTVESSEPSANAAVFTKGSIFEFSFFGLGAARTESRIPMKSGPGILQELLRPHSWGADESINKICCDPWSDGPTLVHVVADDRNHSSFCWFPDIPWYSLMFPDLPESWRCNTNPTARRSRDLAQPRNGEAWGSRTAFTWRSWGFSVMISKG